MTEFGLKIVFFSKVKSLCADETQLLQHRGTPNSTSVNVEKATAVYADHGFQYESLRKSISVYRNKNTQILT